MIAPARTGRERRRRTVVIAAAHTNRGVFSGCSSLIRILKAVVMKLIDPRIDEIPARWSEKIAMSTEGPA